VSGVRVPPPASHGGPPRARRDQPRFWDGLAGKYVDRGRRNGESEEPTWGIFSVPESEVGLLPKEPEGRDSIELRPGGELVFLAGSIFTIPCGPNDETVPAGDQLLRPLFGMHRIEWARRGLGRIPPAGAEARLTPRSSMPCLEDG